MINPPKKEKEKERNIETYINKEVNKEAEPNRAIYSVGAPFFKN